MKVLERLAGTWDTESVNRVSEFNPTETRATGTAGAELTLGGHFVVCRSFDDGENLHGMATYTYDSARKQYRSGLFDSMGNSVEAVGRWDPDTRTLTFTAEQKSRVGWYRFRFIQGSTMEYTIVGKDTRGGTPLDVHGRWTRRK